MDDAIAEFERSLAIEPNAADQHYELGVIQLKASRLDAAATHFRRALELKPDDSESYNSLGAIAYVRGLATRRFAGSSSRCALETTLWRITTWDARWHASIGSTSRFHNTKCP